MPTSVINPQANAILEHVHQVIMAMLHTAEIDMTDSVAASNIDTFLTNVAGPFTQPTIQYFDLSRFGIRKYWRMYF